MSVPLYQAEAEFFADLMRAARRILTATLAGRGALPAELRKAEVAAR
ncbi:hypothetical protein [Streptomyces malaysiensis]